MGIKGRLGRGIDWVLFALCLTLNGLGLILVWSATRFSSAYHSLPEKQLLSLLLGILLFLLVSQMDLTRLGEHQLLLFLLEVGCLLALLTPLGTAGDTGNRNWLTLPGIPFHLQPGEVIRPVFFLLLSAQLAEDTPLHPKPKLLRPLLHLGLICGLMLVISGDAGMTLEFLLVSVLVFWAAGVNKRWFAAAGLLAAAGGAAVWLLLPADNYWKGRILVLLQPDLDPQGYGYQQVRSLLALRSGGFWGMGLHQGTLTQSPRASALPARYTDFIFSVCGEELGFVGCALLLGLLGAIIFRCIHIARTADSPLQALCAAACGGTILVQTALNVGMCLSVAPVIGLTLPFVSYGGSSLLSLWLSVGLTAGINPPESASKSPRWRRQPPNPPSGRRGWGSY